MDKNGRNITLNSKITDLLVPIDTIVNVVVIEQLDGDALDNALSKLDVSLSGYDGQGKKIKLNHILGYNDVSVKNVVELHKSKHQSSCAL